MRIEKETSKKQWTSEKTTRILIVFVVLLLICLPAFARMGGAGGSSGGSGDGDGIGALIFYIIYAIPFPYNLIVLGIFLVIAYYGNKKNKQRSILNKMPSSLQTGSIKGLDAFMQNNPGFNQAAFIEKAKTAFLELQEAWQNKDMSKVRKYISDGMYQRLNIQFKMMGILEQKNEISNLAIRGIQIDRIESDGLFDVIHVGIHASITDRFISKKYPNLNSGGNEDFVEYWSFIKKRGVTEKNIFTSNNCPSCGAELPTNAGEVAQCEYCGTLTNTGEYDWVLSEITQADDYITSNTLNNKASNIHSQINSLAQTNPDFAVQLIEDKACNAFLQIQTARVTKNAAIMRRFTTDDLFEKLKTEFDTESPFVYNRIFPDDVTLIGVEQKSTANTIMVSIKHSFQKVYIENEKASPIDPFVISDTTILFMTRNSQNQNQKGSLYAHRCPSCGSPVKDTIDITCATCGHELNSTDFEWIVSGIMSMADYYTYFNSADTNSLDAVKPSVFDSLFDVRDYAFNNTLIIIAADGIFSEEEKAFANKLAKKLGYHTEKIQPLIKMAQQGQLSLRMPEKQKQREKVYRLMEKAAACDGTIDQSEQEILSMIKQQYSID